MERTKLEEEREEALEDKNETDIKEKKSKADMKSKTVQISEKFDMKDIMSKFIDRMLRLLLTPEGILLNTSEERRIYGVAISDFEHMPARLTRIYGTKI